MIYWAGRMREGGGGGGTCELGEGKTISHG